MDKLKILIAKDEDSTEGFYNKALDGDLFQKHFADNGLDALESYGLWKPDIFIVDLMIPVKSGLEVLKEIRKYEPVSTKTDQDKSKVNVIIMVADDLNFDDDLHECFKLGINSYLMKPLKPYTLQKLIMKTYSNVKEEFKH